MRRGEQLTALKRPLCRHAAMPPMHAPASACIQRQGSQRSQGDTRKKCTVKSNSQQVPFQNKFSNATRKTGDDMLQDAHAKAFYRVPLSLQTVDEESHGECAAKLVC